MTNDTPHTAPQTPAPARGFDFTLEPVILLVLSVFMLLFGILLVPIHTGTLPYAPDSTYGLFLVIIALQVITLGRTPFGNVRRSWLVILVGIAAAVTGMGACFIPGALSATVRTLAGAILLLGGATLLLRHAMDRERARKWIRHGGVLSHLALSCGLVYLMAFLLGLVTLVPAVTTDYLTAAFLLIDGIALAWLAWSINTVERLYPQPAPASAPAWEGGCPFCLLLQDAPLDFTTAILVFLGTLLAFLAILLVPVNLGTLPFSPDGQLGLLLVIMAIQVLAAGETPVGRFRRSWPVVLIGLAFVALGVFSCVVPGIVTGMLVVMLGALNIAGGIVPLALRVYPIVQQVRNPPAAPVAIPPVLKHLLIVQTVLNIVGILFGASMFLPGLIPGMVVAVILFCNGILLFALAYILGRLPAAA
ncbi:MULTISPECIES: hypothetical protein [unclassified Methanoregula]|uniref:hypothetical protein n=1 Tax=unclassified Methanoregula TaxID=2649730 RepID=UPI0009CDD5D7|nr:MULTISPECIES: hypothetical protein [unclassified Methanoregula]OPX62189.1 MAG: hypothetical protein A4E33_02455 [Methanoregula sp. PtaB.Bin085]OPY35602.1 MAG: hypothetical protein A4E34_00602 [Methanoregula sp. PtaU1.Bin006]